MNEYDVCREYLGLKQYFYSTYDYRKYGRMKLSVDAYKKRNDRYYFKRLAEKKDPIGFMVATFIFEDVYIVDLMRDTKYEDNFRRWQRVTQSLSYLFEQELRSFNSLKEAIQVKNGQSELIQKFYQGKVSPETVTILGTTTNCGNYWNRKMQDDPLWEQTFARLSKYKHFLKYDRKKMQGAVRKLLLAA